MSNLRLRLFCIPLLGLSACFHLDLGSFSLMQELASQPLKPGASFMYLWTWN